MDSSLRLHEGKFFAGMASNLGNFFDIYNVRYMDSGVVVLIISLPRSFCWLS